MNRVRLTLGLAVACLAVAAWLLPEFRIEPDLASMLPADHAHVRLAAQLDARAENRRSLFVVLRAETIDEPRLRQVVERLRAVSGVAAVAATQAELLGAEWQRRRAAPLWHLPTDKVAALAERLSADGRRAALQDTLELLVDDPLSGPALARRDPLGLRWLLGDADQLRLPVELRAGTPFVVLADGRRAVLRLVGEKSSFDAQFATRLLDDIEACLDAAGWQHDFFGGYAIARADAARIRHDLVSSIIWSSVLVFLYLLISLRNLAYTLLGMMPVGAAAFCAVSIGSYLFGPLTPIAIAAGAVLFGLGVDFTIHYLIGYGHNRQSHPHAAAAALTSRELGAPLFIGMATTAIAFVSLAFGQFSGLAGFGMLLALGLLLAFLATRFVLPILLGLAPRPPQAQAHSPLARRLDRVANSAHGRRVALAGVGLAVIGWAVVATWGVTLSVAPEGMRPSPDPIAATRARLEAELGFSLMPVLLCVDPVLPERELAAATAALRSEGLLVLVAGGRGAATEERRQLVASFRAATKGWLTGVQTDLADLGFSVEPFMPALRELQQRLAAPAAAAPSAAAPSSAVVLDGRRRRTILCYPAPGIQQAAGFTRLQARVEQLLGDRAEVYGTPVLLAQLRQMLRHDLLQAVGLTMLLAFGLVLVMARSIRAGLLALLPTFCGFSLTLAVLAVCGLPLTLGNFVAIPFLLGIGIDDGVHLVARLRRGAGVGATGVAVVRTSITTILAFGSLVTAQSPGLASMGWIIALGVWCCLLASLVILPALWPSPTTR